MTKRRAYLGIFKEDSPVVEILNSKHVRPDRIGRVPMPFWTTAAARKQLRMIAAEMDTTQQELMTKALNDLFKKYNKPQIA